jgi:hypothetical protein
LPYPRASFHRHVQPVSFSFLTHEHFCLWRRTENTFQHCLTAQSLDICMVQGVPIVSTNFRQRRLKPAMIKPLRSNELATDATPFTARSEMKVFFHKATCWVRHWRSVQHAWYMCVHMCALLCASNRISFRSYSSPVCCLPCYLCPGQLKSLLSLFAVQSSKTRANEKILVCLGWRLITGPHGLRSWCHPVLNKAVKLFGLVSWVDQVTCIQFLALL